MGEPKNSPTLLISMKYKVKDKSTTSIAIMGRIFDVGADGCIIVPDDVDLSDSWALEKIQPTKTKATENVEKAVAVNKEEEKSDK